MYYTQVGKLQLYLWSQHLADSVWGCIHAAWWFEVCFCKPFVRIASFSSIRLWGIVGNCKRSEGHTENLVRHYCTRDYIKSNIFNVVAAIRAREPDFRSVSLLCSNITILYFDDILVYILL